MELQLLLLKELEESLEAEAFFFVSAYLNSVSVCTLLLTQSCWSPPWFDSGFQSDLQYQLLPQCLNQDSPTPQSSFPPDSGWV